MRRLLMLPYLSVFARLKMGHWPDQIRSMFVLACVTRVTPTMIRATLLSVVLLPFSAFSAAPTATRDLPEMRAAFSDAQGSALRNDIAGVRSALRRQARAEIATAEGQIDLALRIMHLVSSVSREGRSDILSELVSDAQDHLSRALALARSDEQRARVLALSGLLNERYVGNLDVAEARYRAAAELDQRHPHAKAAADRLAKNKQMITLRKAAGSRVP